MGLELKPTLWRSCRVLANRHRLRLLRCLLQKSPQTVAEVAAGVRLPVPVASQYLRMLQARGLLLSERSGREVFYSDRADPLVPSAAGLLAAMKTALGPSEESLRDARFALTAFTHPRRIQIVRTLGARALSGEDLSRATGISARALRRHLDKLRRRGVLSRDAELVTRSRKPSPLMQALIRLACGD